MENKQGQDGRALRRCYRCNGEGHIARNCPSKPSPVCFACGAPGHLKKECPTLAGKKPVYPERAYGTLSVAADTECGSKGSGAVGEEPREGKKHAASTTVHELTSEKVSYATKSTPPKETQNSTQCVSKKVSPPAADRGRTYYANSVAHTAPPTTENLVQSDKRDRVEERLQTPRRDKIAPPWATVPFIDTHCHLEYILQRYSHQGSFGTFAEKCGYPDNFEGCISTFCDPAAFSPSLGMWVELLSEDGVWGTFGIHPHNAKYYNTQVEDRLLECLKHPKCVAFGEVGLDYAKHSPSDEQTQKRVLVQQLRLAIAFGKPLLLHCRNAEEDLLEALSVHVPSDWKIHLHCFTGGLEMSQKFLSGFANLYIGISGNVTFAKAHNVKQVAREIPLERLLLETDSPYNTPENLPRHLRCRNNHPALVLYVAKEIAKLRQINVDDVLRASRSNTRALYGV